MSPCFWNFCYSPFLPQADTATCKHRLTHHSILFPYTSSCWCGFPTSPFVKSPIQLPLPSFQISLAYQASLQHIAPPKALLCIHPHLKDSLRFLFLVYDFHLPVLSYQHLLWIPFLLLLLPRVQSVKLYLDPGTPMPLEVDMHTYPTDAPVIQNPDVSPFGFSASGQITAPYPNLILGGEVTCTPLNASFLLEMEEHKHF